MKEAALGALIIGALYYLTRKPSVPRELAWTLQPKPESVAQ